MHVSQTNIGRQPAIRLNKNDNVLIARHDIIAGEYLIDEDIEISQHVPAGYKLAAKLIKKGESVRKYNVTIGVASEDITPGALVHTHNTTFQEKDRSYKHATEFRPVEKLPMEERASFQGIVREDGRVGTRNYIGICSTVNCSATAVKMIAAWFTKEKLAEWPNIDGVVAFSHDLGCGMEMTGEPMSLLRRTIAGYAKHANIAATLIVGLGCERNQIEDLMKNEGLQQGPKLYTLTMQEVGGTRKTIEAGICAVKTILPEANNIRRQTVDASHLTVGLQCGGSDGFSSITANPALGRAVDILIQNGGTGILSETPEIYGVEHTLTRRAVSVEVGEKLIERVDWWKNEYSVGRDVQINGRVSPGNSKGGLINITEKSLGSSMKGGTGPLMEVYKYAEPVMEKGFVFMDTPGYDPVSVTGQVAGGANLIAFTTGRGSMFGSKPTPCLKLATNSPMFWHLEEDMDLNCGEIIDGTKTLEEMGQAIFELFLSTASGQPTKSEILGIGDNEFVPWSIGIVG